MIVLVLFAMAIGIGAGLLVTRKKELKARLIIGVIIGALLATAAITAIIVGGDR